MRKLVPASLIESLHPPQEDLSSSPVASPAATAPRLLPTARGRDSVPIAQSPPPVTRQRQVKKAARQIDQLRLELGERFELALPPTRDQDAARADHIGFSLFLLVCTLPHQDPHATSYSRVWGRHEVLITSGLGVPYGSIPRLLVTHLITEVRRTKRPTVRLGSSLTAVAGRLGISQNGQSFARYKDNVLRCLSTTYSFRERPTAADPRTRWRTLTLASEGDIGGDTGWGGVVTVSADLYDEILTKSFPLWLTFLRQLMRSPLAMDLYAWLAHQTWTAAKRRKPIQRTYEELMFFFGSDYTETKAFGRRVRMELALILRHIPEWHVRAVPGGLEILPSSQPHVPPACVLSPHAEDSEETEATA